jgi:hypothetical protein
MGVVVPTWFKQRQGKAEEAGENRYRLTGPNLREAYIGIRRGENGHWAAVMQKTADGPDVAATERMIDSPYEAWQEAFELYRCYLVI